MINHAVDTMHRTMSSLPRSASPKKVASSRCCLFVSPTLTLGIKYKLLSDVCTISQSRGTALTLESWVDCKFPLHHEMSH